MEYTTTHVRVCVLGPLRLEIDGALIRLPPYTRRLLLRLVAAEGRALTIRDLRRDVWDIGEELPHQNPRGRNEVQKRILELRRKLDGAAPGTGRRVLQTSQLPTARGPETTYRLVLRAAELDCAEFTALVNGALCAPPAEAVRKLNEAMALYSGRPMADTEGEKFARPLADRLHQLYECARRELIRCHMELGRGDLALPLAERMAAEAPDNTQLAELLDRLRGQLRSERRYELLRARLPGLPNQVCVVRGDLFEQTDANLVIGFTDTFDTQAGADQVISAQSVQGQLVERLFGGDARQLDARLRAGLRTVSPIGVERAQDKPKGKRLRYPIGTVVPITAPGDLRVFATAYSRLGNDLVARSDEQDLDRALRALWPTVARAGLHRPVAVPLLGSGLARIVQAAREQLAAAVIDSFFAACRLDPRTAPELRIVVRAQDLPLIDLAAVGEHLAGLRAMDPV